MIRSYLHPFWLILLRLILPRLILQRFAVLGRAVLGIVVLAGLIVLSAGPAFATCQADGLSLEQAQLRATPPNAPVSAGYFQITNITGQPQTLISVAAPFAQRAEIHDMKLDDGVMRMFEIEGGLVVPHGLTVKLMPGGRHLMFMGLDRQLKEDDIFALTLEFAPCGQVTLPFYVTRLPSHDKES